MIDPAIDQFPVWTPDSRRVVFTSNREGGTTNLWWQPADGTGTAERLTTSPNIHAATDVSADGGEVIFQEVAGTIGTHLMRVSLDASHRVTPMLQTRVSWNGALSPDGHWLAYESDSAGRNDVYVSPYPRAGGGERQISTAGGLQPVWARSGKELFYIAPDGSMMGVSVETRGGTWQPVSPMKLFQGSYDTRGPAPLRMYDVSPDGKRFLMLKPARSDQTTLIIVQHFTEELRRLAPSK